MVLPAPDGPTRAVSCPGGAWKVTPRSTGWTLPARSGVACAIDSSEASDTSLAAG